MIKQQYAKSNFVGYFGINNYSKIKQDLIQPKVEAFFKQQGVIHFKEIDEHAIFADQDFLDKTQPFLNPFFYEFIVNDIRKVNGKIEIPVTYCITLDETNCSKTCDITGVRYDEMLLYNQPVFYFIYIDIKDVFACLKN